MKKKVQTRYAKYKAIQEEANESVESIQAKTEDLKYKFNTLVNYLDKRLKDPKIMSHKDRVAKEKRVVKEVKPISIILETIHENLDPAMQKKFEEFYKSAFKTDRAFDAAMAKHMKGQVNSKMTTFLGKVSQLIAQQDGSRLEQINAIRKSEAVIKAEKVSKSPVQQVAHILRPGHMSTKEVGKQRKGKKALYSRAGDTTEKSSKRTGNFFDKIRRSKKEEKGTGKGFGK